MSNISKGKLNKSSSNLNKSSSTVKKHHVPSAYTKPAQKSQRVTPQPSVNQTLNIPIQQPEINTSTLSQNKQSHDNSLISNNSNILKGISNTNNKKKTTTKYVMPTGVTKKNSALKIGNKFKSKNVIPTNPPSPRR